MNYLMIFNFKIKILTATLYINATNNVYRTHFHGLVVTTNGTQNIVMLSTRI